MVMFGFDGNCAPVVEVIYGDWPNDAAHISLAIALGWQPWAVGVVADAFMQDMRDWPRGRREASAKNYHRGDMDRAHAAGDPAVREVMQLTIATTVHLAQHVVPYHRDDDGVPVFETEWHLPAGAPGGLIVDWCVETAAMSSAARDHHAPPTRAEAMAVLRHIDCQVTDGDTVVRKWN